MHRVRVARYEVSADSYGYPRVSPKLDREYDGDLLAIVGAGEKVVYVIATNDGEIKEEVQGCAIKIRLLSG